MSTNATKEQVTEILAERLLTARKNAGYKTRQAALDAFGWSFGTYRSHEDGSRRITRSSAEMYAEAFGVSIQHLLGHDLYDTTTTPPAHQHAALPVYGVAAGGTWIDSTDFDGDTTENINALGVANFPIESQFLRKVVGNSVSNRIPSGAFAILVKSEEYGPIPMGKLVCVRRDRGGMTEYSVKVFYGDKLFTDSAQLAEQKELDMRHTDDGTTVYIEGVVVGAHIIL